MRLLSASLGFPPLRLCLPPLFTYSLHLIALFFDSRRPLSSRPLNQPSTVRRPYIHANPKPKAPKGSSGEGEEEEEEQDGGERASLSSPETFRPPLVSFDPRFPLPTHSLELAFWHGNQRGRMSSPTRRRRSGKKRGSDRYHALRQETSFDERASECGDPGAARYALRCHPLAFRDKKTGALRGRLSCAKVASECGGGSSNGAS